MADNTTTDDTKTDPPKPDQKADPPKPDGELGDGGKRALEQERKDRKAAEKAAREAQAELEQLRVAAMSDQEKAVNAAKIEGRTEALTLANERLVRAEVKAAAGSKLADPEDAVRLLNLSDFAVGDDGSIDTKTIASAIDGLVEAKPYLAATARNTGSIHSGPQSNDGGTSDNPDAWLRAQAQR